MQAELKPVGQLECELVQIIVDCHWRLRGIQELEYALYAHGEKQLADAFADEPELNRRSMIVLQSHLTYQKELHNLHIQEARIDRKRAKALTELNGLQSDRAAAGSDQTEKTGSVMDNFKTDAELFAALDAGYVPPYLVPHLSQNKPASEDGFDFSNSDSETA